MKRSILGINRPLSCQWFVKTVAILVLIVGNTHIYGQVDCNTTMACNDGVQVSLDELCQAVISPDMLLENPEYADSEYTVEVKMPNGNIVPNATVNYNHINMELEVQIILTECGTSCWGHITVEDKLPPVISTCLDYEVDCDDDITPGAGIIPFPTASDACSNVTDLEYNDIETTLPCSADFAKTIMRSWTVTDEQGNEATCEQTINVRRANIMSIMFPPNYDDIEEDAFSCNDVLDLLPNGAPSPEMTGYPEGANCPNIQVHYTDVIFEICGASKKVLRRWLVLDWCSGQERTENQTIKILDEVAPICTSEPDFVEMISTDPAECTGTYTVPAPIVTFECSGWDYEVSYKLRDENGNPFLNPITDNVSRDANGVYTISELPQDTSWIIYTLTDDCGNVSQCFSEVYVQDNEAPNPVCEGYTVIGLEDQGWADLYATSVDDGSFDNCEVVKLEIKRDNSPCGFPSDLQFGETVNFCCEDVSEGYIKVTMRAYDAAGNYNDCIVNVTVQDKMNPTITCPSNITIPCDADYENTALTGLAVAEDNCSAEVSFLDNVSLNDCGIGTVTRTWTATDPQGLKATCVQVITVGDNDPFSESDINWPNDRNENGCDASTVSPEALNSFPTISNDNCASIAVSYDDDVFYSVPDYCIKVLRHWKVADWCNNDPQNPTYFEYTQKIAIYNTEAPELEGCDDKEIQASTGDCEATISETVTATDDCTPGALLKYSYTLDQDNNGSIDITGNGNSLNGTYPSGTHKLTWIVVDACGNEAECSYLITIVDNKAPTPICIGSVVWALDENGEAEVWASDFNLKSEDTCDDEAELTYSFNAAGTQPALSFTCADLDNGISQDIELQMYVIDSDGNSEYCDVILQLQDSDSNNACLDVLGAQGRIEGMILTTADQGITDIEVELQSDDTASEDMDMTESGEYAFEAINYYNQYIVAPTKNDDVNNGVNTLDLVKIQRHILGLETITDPYLLIAADINGSDRVTAADLLALRKVILGVTSEFPNNKSWRFIPAGYEFEDEADPFGFSEQIEVSAFYHNLNHADFLAIKVGDIDGTAQVNTNGLVANNGTTAIAAVAPEFEAGEIFTVDFTANELDQAVGMQFTLDFDADALAFSTLTSGAIAVADDNMQVSYTDQGHIAISWNDVNALTLNADDILFTVTFKAKQGGDIADYIGISSSTTNAELYDADLQTTALALEVKGAADVAAEQQSDNKLLQNSPNPFTTSTTIPFELATDSRATVTVYDIAGTIITNVTGQYQAGYNEVTISLDENAVDGVLYYRLETNDFQATRKMVVIR